MVMEQIQKINDFIKRADVLDWFLSEIKYLLSNIFIRR